MPTPAEIIAARVNGTYEETYGSTVSDTDTNSFEDDNSTLASSIPSISDESAFPTLGGGKKAANNANGSTVLWGPSMKSPSSGSTAAFTGSSNSSNGVKAAPAPAHAMPSLPATASSSTSKSTSGLKFKLSTIQEAFSLDVNDQLAVAKPELIKILTAIKSETKTNIECTTSQHIKKRTFLITGKADDVKQAKKLVIMKLTKPLTLTFAVPSVLRSKIIGPQGRVLKPIISANGVKIDIGNEEFQLSEAADEDADIFNTCVNVSVTGYAEGCKAAEAQILAIVKAETKALPVKIKVDSALLPFASNLLTPLIAQYPNLDINVSESSGNIYIEGDRSVGLVVKKSIKEAWDNFKQNIVTEEVPIPKVKHQFLPIETILKEENVLIKLPEEGESTVKFIGEKNQIAKAQSKAKQITSQYKVEVLDMSKAHRGNLKHVTAVASFLNKNGVLSDIAKNNDVVINVPDNDTLAQSTITSIPIEIVSKGEGQADAVKSTKKSIVSVVNKITPDQTFVIEDIDSFLINKVPSVIGSVAKENGVSFVIVGDVITLFSEKQDTIEESEDFDDTPQEAFQGFEKVNEQLASLRELASTLSSKVLDIDSKDQDYITGANGSTLRSILGFLEPNSVEVKLHSDGKAVADDKVYVHGLGKEVTKAVKLIQEVVSDGKEFASGYTTTISIPSVALSRLIGKSGSNINSIREEFCVEIDVDEESKSEEPKDKNGKTKLVVSGSKTNVTLCKEKILSVTEKWADEILVRVKVESQYHRRMIGPNRVYVNRLQDKYNVRIRFPSIDFDGSNIGSSDPQSKDEVTIKGASKGVRKAEEELKELYQFEKENGFKEVINIPTKAVARVIGKAGETINDIADGTGIEYNFKRDREAEEKSGFAEVEITGSKSALKEAKKKIQDLVDEVENFSSVTIRVDPKYHRELIGSGGSFMKQIVSKAGGDDLPRNKYYRILSIPNEGSGSDEVVSEGPKDIVDKVIEQIKQIIAHKEASVAEEFELVKEKHRLVVGPSGSTRQALQTEFDVVIDIPRPQDESTVIKIQGLPEKVEAVKAKLTELTKDDWNISIDIPQELHALVSERGAIFNTLKRDFSVEVQHGNLTRQAAKLSNAPIPSPSEEAYPAEGVKTQFTVVDKEQTDSSEKSIPWRLKGEEKNTTKAAKFLEERLQMASSADHIGWFYSSEPSSFSKLVGSQGSKVNQIRKKSNTFITIPRAGDKNANFVYLVGTKENLELAKAEIEKLLK